jgi:hypothetical protein
MRTFIRGLLFLFATGAFGQIIYETDPTNFHMGNGVGGTCPTGVTGVSPCTALYQNTELLAISSHFDLYFNTHADSKMVGDEVLLIIGVPNDSAQHNILSARAITSATEFDPYTAGSGTGELFSFGVAPQGYNIPSGETNGFAGLFTTGDLYNDFLGGDPALLNASQSFVNWSGADSTVLGITAHNFGIYIWSIHTSTFSANDALDFTGSGIPLGSFALGFGESQTQKCTGLNAHSTCTTNITPFGNAFTQTGLVTWTDSSGGPQGSGVPEPGSIILLGSSLVATFTMLRKKLIHP